MASNTDNTILTDTTLNGIEVTCIIDQEQGLAVVEYNHTLQFVFNSDMPHDAKTFFDALLNVDKILLMDEEEREDEDSTDECEK